MNARVGRRHWWLALSALVVILLFATVAADAKLHGTRPPAAAAFVYRVTDACADPVTCPSRSVPVRKAARARDSNCSAPLFQTL
jgi:hypothetical protein